MNNVKWVVVLVGGLTMVASLVMAQAPAAVKKQKEWQWWTKRMAIDWELAHKDGCLTL